jgi:glycosyltransferase involved in cell wall biosynthesis
MKFSVITPTYQRPDGLIRAISSVLAQSHADWEMIIINDNPGDDTDTVVTQHHDDRILYHELIQNSGANAARNYGLDHIADDSDYIVFLDDDDYLAPEALTTIKHLLDETAVSWLATARGTDIHTSTTIGTARTYHYLRDYLVRRRFRGDATHAIKAEYIDGTVASLRFPTSIRQGEEWLFYANLGRYTDFRYEPIVTTLTDGYTSSGLNHRYRSTAEQLRTVGVFIKEGFTRKLLLHPLFMWYILMRVVRAFIKHT